MNCLTQCPVGQALIEFNKVVLLIELRLMYAGLEKVFA